MKKMLMILFLFQGIPIIAMGGEQQKVKAWMTNNPVGTQPTKAASRRNSLSFNSLPAVDEEAMLRTSCSLPATGRQSPVLPGAIEEGRKGSAPSRMSQEQVQANLC